MKSSKVQHQPMEISEFPEGPWVEIGSDIFIFQSKPCLLVVDYYTKWIEAKPVLSQTSSSIITVLK